VMDQADSEIVMRLPSGIWGHHRIRSKLHAKRLALQLGALRQFGIPLAG
jgi:hypothetical protein